jgi:hypothetical protein
MALLRVPESRIPSGITKPRHRREFTPILMTLPGRETPSQVDIHVFVCYMPALRVKGQAFAAPSLYQNSEPIN